MSRRALARGSWLGAALLLALAGGAQAALPLPWTRSIPGPGRSSELYADTCTASGRCFAVGFYDTGARAALGQVLDFNGRRWSRVSIPQPGGRRASDYDYLLGIACTSSSNCWAVGYYGNARRGARNEALHFNGKKWRLVTLPQPAGTKRSSENRLDAVTCLSRSNCWAVGDRTNRAGAYLDQALHWNGKRWRAVPTPDPQGSRRGRANVQSSVSCASASDCVSVGSGRNGQGAYINEALRWNGRRWKRASVPQPGGSRAHDYGVLAGVACPSRSECLAVGGYYTRKRAYVNEALRWTAGKWRLVATPDPGGQSALDDNELTSLSCTTNANCWAVGYYTTARRGDFNEALLWNGKRWLQGATVQPYSKLHGNHYNTLYGVSCASVSDCWAVGYLTGGAPINVALHWTGAKWVPGARPQHVG